MDRKIEFIKNYTHPVFGNVYIGKQAIVPTVMADTLIHLGNAVDVKERMAAVAVAQKNSFLRRKKKGDE